MNPFKTFLIAAALVGGLSFSRTIHAQGTAFTYQGHLLSGGQSASGSYDLTFSLYNAASDGTLVAGPLTNKAVTVSNGLFTTTLDFGASAFNGSSNWLEIGVRPNGDESFITLSPRQALTSAPYAIYSANAGSVSAANVSGVLPASSLPTAVVTNNATSITLNGTFNGNGAGITNVSAGTISGTVPVSHGGTGATSISGITNTLGLGAMAFQPTNGPVFTNAGISATNLSLAGNSSLYEAELDWNQGILTSPQDNYFSLWGHVGHGGSGNGLEWQWSFNQLYFGPVNGGHVQFGLSTDNQGDAFIAQWFNTGGILTNPNRSHAIGWHVKAGLPGGPIAQGDEYWHTYLSTYDMSNYYSIWHLSGWNGDSQQDWHTVGPDMVTMDSDHGFEVKGYLRLGYVNSSGNASSMAVDYTNMAAQEFDLFQATSFYETNLNLLGHWTNSLMQYKELFLYSPWTNVAVSFPANWTWEGETNISAVAPTSVPYAHFLHIKLTVLAGVGKTNWIAHPYLGSYTPTMDPLAAAYFTTANITNNLQKQAYNNLALNLRGHGLATTNKLIALYAFSGNSPASDTIDFMGSHNGTFHGTVTHSPASGITGDGATGYMDTGIVPNNGLASPASCGILVWNRTAVPNDTSAFMGAIDFYPTNQSTWICLERSGVNFRMDGPSDFVTEFFGTSNWSGFIAEDRLDSGDVVYYHAGNVDLSNDSSVQAGRNESIYVLCRNDRGTPDWFSNANLSVAGVLQNMSPSDMDNLQSDLAQWEAAMGR